MVKLLLYYLKHWTIKMTEQQTENIDINIKEDKNLDEHKVEETQSTSPSNDNSVTFETLGISDIILSALKKKASKSPVIYKKRLFHYFIIVTKTL